MQRVTVGRAKAQGYLRSLVRNTPSASAARSYVAAKQISSTSFGMLNQASNFRRLPTQRASFRRFTTDAGSSTRAPKSVVSSGDRVHVNLTAKDAATGEALFDTEGEPISFVVGQGQVIVGLERRIIGTKVGESWTETFEPAEAFGIVDPEKFKKIAKPTDAEMLKELRVGSTVQLHNGEMARVLKIEDDYMIIDLNSTLAGRKVTFTVTLAKIEDEVNNVMSGVQVQTIKQGDGKTFPKSGSRVSVHYTGTLADSGREFDSSRRGNRPPFSFVLGAGLVIRGWDVGIGKLSLGERAMLYIPSEMGYGSRGAGGVIPQNANLVFDVELVEIDGVKAAST